ncbi:MAG: hypothetical protein KKD44_10360 [Proteobacteria bacterium]|nr:hypothetical protein [Pseudomonadota bacterium]
MKKSKLRYQKTDDGAKKSILKFRDYEEDVDDEIFDDEKGSSGKRRKDVGKRFHRKKTLKDDFSEF